MERSKQESWLLISGIPMMVFGFLMLTVGCGNKPAAPVAPAVSAPCVWGYNGVGIDLGPAIVSNPLPVGPSSVGIPFIAQAVTVSAPVTARSLSFYITFSGTDQAMGAVYDTALDGGPGDCMAASASSVTLTSGAWNTLPLTLSTSKTFDLTFIPGQTYWLAVMFPTTTNSFYGLYTYYTPTTPYDAYGEGLGTLFIATNVPWGAFPTDVLAHPYGFAFTIPSNLSLYVNTCQ